ncbi:MAG: RDD family protein [Candidatus Glassbacteria bacterium]|nr:RDD family protein [Candidatus Glassbacteria bacterium]
MVQTRYAPFSRRFAAYIIDKAILALITAFIMIPPVSFFPRLFFHHGTYGFFSFGYGSVFVLVNWIYFTLLESSPRQATIGKIAMGIFVTDEYGGRLSVSRALARTLSKVISTMFCWLGYLLALFTGRSQALHDLLASSLVLEPDYRTASQYYAPGAPQAGPAAPGPQAAPADSADQGSGTIQL